MDTADSGIVHKPDSTKGIDFFVDADFAGGWSQLDADNAKNMMSCKGYVITYALRILLWCSKLQT